MSRVGPSPDVAHVASVVDGVPRVALLDLRDLAALPRVLEGPAALIWAALADGATLDEIVREVAVATEEAPDHIAADVRGFVDTLVEDGLVRTL